MCCGGGYKDIRTGVRQDKAGNKSTGSRQTSETRQHPGGWMNPGREKRGGEGAGERVGFGASGLDNPKHL